MSKLTATQRYLTTELLTKRKIIAEADWLKPETAILSEKDKTTILDDWQSPQDERNLGVRLSDGLVELQIRSQNDIWIKEFFFACTHLKIDSRFAFCTDGRPISSILFQASPGKLEYWRNVWPKPIKDKQDSWVATQLNFTDAPARGKPILARSQPLPGSRFNGGPVVWRPNGKPANDDPELGYEDLEAIRPLAATSCESIARAIAFATAAYWIRVYLDGLTEWDSSLTRIIGGWIARLVKEGKEINATGMSLENVCWAVIDTPETAKSFLIFLRTTGANKEIEFYFSQAERHMELGEDKKVPGWSSLEPLGVNARGALRRVFRAGIELDRIEQLAEQYVYDRSSHLYLDRYNLMRGLPFEFEREKLIQRHDNEKIFTGKKYYNSFHLYTMSELRTDAHTRAFRPAHEPGAVLRFSPLYNKIVSGDEILPDEQRVFNTFQGFNIKPIGIVDPTVMSAAVTALDRLIALLTCDNDDQILWLKKWVAWTLQFPEIKQQVCPVMIGGQGIGKSTFGQDLMRALIGNMAAKTSAKSLGDNRFSVSSLINKIIVFVDEARIESITGIDTLKLYIRSDSVAGELKYEHAQDFYIPARLILAANQIDIGLHSEDAADRALFFMLGWSQDLKRMTTPQFQKWAWELKGFFDSLFEQFKDIIFMQHLMRYFMDLEVTKAELEDLTYSSRGDERVVRATMSKACLIGRQIVAGATIVPGQDIIVWFTYSQLHDAIKRVSDNRRVETDDVLEDWKRTGVLEEMGGEGNYFRFKYGYGKLLSELGKAHGLKIQGHHATGPGTDWEDNSVTSQYVEAPWRGLKQKSKPKPQKIDPDDMEPFD